MAGSDLQAFLAELERQGELCRVPVAVDPCLEISALTNRVCKGADGGKALFFQQVIGSAMPVVTNLFGSWRRLAIAFDVEDTLELVGRVTELFNSVAGNGLAERCAAIRQTRAYAASSPQLQAIACCQEVVEREPDLTSLPLLKNWPGDGGPAGTGLALSLPLVFTRDPLTGLSNCGMYRVEMLTDHKAAIHWRKGSGGARHYAAWQQTGQRMPVAVALGGDPLLSLMAAFPLPEPLEELHFAGYLRGKAIEVVRCVTNELLVPAAAELVIEGYLSVGEQVEGGSFGNHTGYYMAPGVVPVMHVSCISHRASPIFPATVIGPPPMEDCYLAKAAGQLLLPFIRQELPEIVAINLPMSGIFHGCALIAINRTGADHPRMLMERIWQGGWLGAGRLLVVLDADTDLNDLAGVAWRIINRVDWQHDLVFPPVGEDTIPVHPGLPFAGRMGIDATRKKGSATCSSGWPSELAMPASIEELVTRKWQQYGV